MSNESWKLESDLCRCCHSEGKFKNLSMPCKNSDFEEIYSDMLKNCFDISVSLRYIHNFNSRIYGLLVDRLTYSKFALKI